MTKRLSFITSALMFIGVSLFLWSIIHSTAFASTLNRPMPKFEAENLLKAGSKISNKDFKGHVSLLVVWGSWCPHCLSENSFLMDIARKNIVTLYGLDYRDSSKAAQAALRRYGNPYKAVFYDSRLADKLGIYGTPQSFLIDKSGVIRYTHVGELNHRLWRSEFMPRINRLNG